MTTERYLEILELLLSEESSVGGKSKLCVVAAQITHMDGAGVAIITQGNDVLEFCSSNLRASRLLDLEVLLGQGPCLASWAAERAIFQPDLCQEVDSNLGAYAPMALSEKVRSIFAFPVQIGAVALGALFLFSQRPGELSDQQISDGYLCASMAARAVLALQSGASDSLLSSELEQFATFDFIIQQAAGKVAVQGSMSVHEALVLIRAHGFSLGIRSSQLARSIVDGNVEFNSSVGEWCNVNERGLMR